MGADKSGSRPQLTLPCGQSPWPVAGLTLLGCRHVEEHVLAFDRPDLFVASLTPDVLVQTLQGKGSPPVMIEQ